MNCEPPVSFFQCHTLNHLQPAQLEAHYLLIVIWQGNHCNNMNLQQIIVCSARKIRSNNSTLGARGVASGGYGLGPDPSWRHVWKGNLCTVHMLLKQLHINHCCTSAQKTFHDLNLHYGAADTVFFTSSDVQTFCPSHIQLNSIS